MGHFKDDASARLNNLITETVMYRLTETQALQYIEINFGQPISRQTYFDRKKNLTSDEHARAFIYDQTRVGFVLRHEKHLNVIEKIMDDTIKRCDIEMNKPITTKDRKVVIRDEDKLNVLKKLLCEIVRLSSELNVGNPVIATMKADVDNADSKYQQLVKKIRKLNPEIKID